MAFATLDDITTVHPGTDAGRAMLLIDLATAAIAQAADKDDEWADTLTPVPAVLRGLCIALVGRALANPEGLGAMSEQLGAYQYSKSFGRTNGAGATFMSLSSVEELLVRRTVYGTTTASVRVESLGTDLCVICGISPRLCGGEWLLDCDCSGS